MKRIAFISLLLFLFVDLSSIAQSKKNTANQNIQLLKNGALLVRLKTSENLINAYLKKGKIAEAEKIKEEQLNKNKEIVAAFKSQFTFCKVYFFYSNNSTKVKAGNTAGCLFNSEFEIDSTFTSTDFIIGEFDESATTSIDAFILKDKNYVQLKPPFPFMVNVTKTLVLERSKEEVVKELNAKLTDFWMHQ